MDLFFYAKHNPLSGISLRRVLDYFWFAGLIFGTSASMYTGDSIFPMMRAAVFGGMSISGALSVLLLPLLFSAFAVYIHQTFLLLPIAFCKAFLFSFVAMGLKGVFGSVGWLFSILLLFADGLSLVVLWWFWNRSFISSQSQLLLDFIAALISIAAVGSADYLFIAPFLADLISR